MPLAGLGRTGGARLGALLLVAALLIYFRLLIPLGPCCAPGEK